MGSSMETLEMIAWVGVCFVCILVHELGHALTAKAFGERNGRIVLYEFGGLAYSNTPSKGFSRILVIFMGPGAGFILLGVVWAITGQGIINDWGEGLMGFAVHQAYWICLWWGLINLLPVYPLDGGQLLYETLRLRWPTRAFGVTRVVSCATAFTAAAGFAWRHFEQGGGLDGGLYSTALFLVLGFYSLRLGRTTDQESKPLEDWQKDPDYWKR
jgi:Zn-dependent protease